MDQRAIKLASRWTLTTTDDLSRQCHPQESSILTNFPDRPPPDANTGISHAKWLLIRIIDNDELATEANLGIAQRLLIESHLMSVKAIETINRNAEKKSRLHVR